MAIRRRTRLIDIAHGVSELKLRSSDRITCGTYDRWAKKVLERRPWAGRRSMSQPPAGRTVDLVKVRPRAKASITYNNNDMTHTYLPEGGATSALPASWVEIRDSMERGLKKGECGDGGIGHRNSHSPEIRNSRGCYFTSVFGESGISSPVELTRFCAATKMERDAAAIKQQFTIEYYADAKSRDISQ
ncbi:hypothetical protein EVAR_6384_1 [Eumeta japonica]|uniref:Uncharacterized protein n=1 Tax=Eumeta variegata TaxID=151549 RepID=A0A4C1TDL3_EUMVA|nr:hypothetical protein EVAR_6384_1 [Eumeta japonica]